MSTQHPRNPYLTVDVIVAPRLEAHERHRHRVLAIRYDNGIGAHGLWELVDGQWNCVRPGGEVETADIRDRQPPMTLGGERRERTIEQRQSRIR